MKVSTSYIVLLLLLLTGCRSEPKDFTLSFVMESIDNYKLSIETGNDKSYHIRQQNLYLDAHANQEHINTSQGRMTDEEFAELKELIAGSRLFKMKDSYGFGEDKDDIDPFSIIIYTLHYTEGSKEKFITLRFNAQDKYPEKFPELIRFLAQYASQKIESNNG
jgi:hypothetical protein